MTSQKDKPDRVDTAPPVCTISGHRFLVILVMVLVMALTTLGACSPNDSAPASETAVTPEIRQLLDDYTAAWNAYDVDALRPLLTDDFMVYETNLDPKHGLSTGADFSDDLADTLSRVEGSRGLNLQTEWLGEPIMTGDDPWLVSWAWRATSNDYKYPEVEGITTYTIVDEDGTLKIARAVAVSFAVE